MCRTGLSVDNLGEGAMTGAEKCAGTVARMVVFVNDPKLGFITLEGLSQEFRSS
jgi:hypothetical protein